jgi:transcription termination/antitermination protein NusG
VTESPSSTSASFGAIDTDEAPLDTIESPAVEGAEVEAPADLASPAEPEVEADPAEEFRDALRRAPGDWYVVHTYAG